MKAMLRLGSGWHDVEAQIKAVTELGLDPRHFILVTDDSHSGTLVNDGHMNRVVRYTIEQGVDPLIAIQMATLNTAEHFRVAHDVGQIAPGRFADILLIPDLEQFEVGTVIAKGVIAAIGGELQIEIPNFDYPADVKQSVNLGRTLSAEDFVISTTAKGQVEVNVIGVIENQAPTKHLKIEMDVVKGELISSTEDDIAKIALVERHQGTGEVQLGFVQGFGFTSSCAIGSTVAHDSHHMIVVGTDEGNMAIAVNELGRIGGGQIVVLDGKIIGLVELPIAGLMSDERAEIVAQKAETILEGFHATGCNLRNANMQLSLLALVVIPELRISDKGLVDVTKFELVPLIEK
jgi:adenine deaminase